MELLLSTRLGAFIPNEQGPELNQLRVKAFITSFKNKFGFNELRARSTSLYNCHGLTFASRRTQIDDADIEWVLEEDGYTKVGDWKKVQIGDIIVYRYNGSIMHTGLVVKVNLEAELSQGLIECVLSKWGQGPEYFHHPANVPEYYGEWEFWTDRSDF